LGYAGLPFGGAGGVGVGAAAVYGYGDGHVDYVELVDGFDAEVGEGGVEARKATTEILRVAQNDEVGEAEEKFAWESLEIARGWTAGVPPKAWAARGDYGWREP
jgi:hypothetical protein